MTTYNVTLDGEQRGQGSYEEAAETVDRAVAELLEREGAVAGAVEAVRISDEWRAGVAADRVRAAGSWSAEVAGHTVSVTAAQSAARSEA